VVSPKKSRRTEGRCQDVAEKIRKGLCWLRKLFQHSKVIWNVKQNESAAEEKKSGHWMLHQYRDASTIKKKAGIKVTN
jgi:hypothetical protein